MQTSTMVRCECSSGGELGLHYPPLHIGKRSILTKERSYYLASAIKSTRPALSARTMVLPSRKQSSLLTGESSGIVFTINQGIAFNSLYVCRTTQPMARRLVISICPCPMIVTETSSSKACFNVCTGDIGIFPTPSPPDSSLVSSIVQRMLQHPVRCTASKLVLRTARSLSPPMLPTHSKKTKPDHPELQSVEAISVDMASLSWVAALEHSMLSKVCETCVANLDDMS